MGLSFNSHDFPTVYTCIFFFQFVNFSFYPATMSRSIELYKKFLFKKGKVINKFSKRTFKLESNLCQNRKRLDALHELCGCIPRVQLSVCSRRVHMLFQVLPSIPPHVFSLVYQKWRRLSMTKWIRLDVGRIELPSRNNFHTRSFTCLA